jgi:hypothetical protein
VAVDGDGAGSLATVEVASPTVGSATVASAEVVLVIGSSDWRTEFASAGWAEDGGSIDVSGIEAAADVEFDVGTWLTATDSRSFQARTNQAKAARDTITPARETATTNAI